MRHAGSGECNSGGSRTSYTRMGLKDRNNPLGQRTPSDKVGGPAPGLKHGQSSELVEEIRRKADRLQKKDKDPKKESAEYDITGPDRQPGKIARQSKLGTQRRKSQQGQYTQDNEEEGPLV
jgi:hypothetical protein